jgi:hypothetical protein
MKAVIVRIILRYASGFLIAKGLVGVDFAQDPDVAMLAEAILGGAIMVGTEVWYWAAKKYGWVT